jgi:hypothetical protein
VHLADDAHRTRFEPGTRLSQGISTYHEDVTIMSEEAEKARQALQESMDLRDQGHSDD